MKEIVVISGKGGTGKTSVTASFAVMAGKNVIVADCDVDAADMHLLMEPETVRKEDFFSGELAVIKKDSCTSCGKCAEICRFGAVFENNGVYSIDPLSCEGCGYCSRICPSGAIVNSSNNVGELYISRIRTGTAMAHARLGIGAENSGKLVTKVKNEARTLAEDGNIQTVIVDGSPGVGCPVVSSLSGASYTVLVTEPSVSGLHDLKRVYELVKKFGIRTGCIINKADINSEMAGRIKSFLELEGVPLLAEIPYTEAFVQAIAAGKTVAETDFSIRSLIASAWELIEEQTGIKTGK